MPTAEGVNEMPLALAGALLEVEEAAAKATSGDDTRTDFLGVAALVGNVSSRVDLVRHRYLRCCTRPCCRRTLVLE